MTSGTADQSWERVTLVSDGPTGVRSYPSRSIPTSGSSVLQASDALRGGQGPAFCDIISHIGTRQRSAGHMARPGNHEDRGGGGPPPGVSTREATPPPPPPPPAAPLPRP